MAPMGLPLFPVEVTNPDSKGVWSRVRLEKPSPIGHRNGGGLWIKIFGTHRCHRTPRSQTFLARRRKVDGFSCNQGNENWFGRRLQIAHPMVIAGTTDDL